jgi:hypothetical protein
MLHKTERKVNVKREKTENTLIVGADRREKKKMFMAINQYGDTIHGLKYPRRDLLKKTGEKTAEKIYIDRGGKTFHTGYIIRGQWFRLYEVKPYEKKVK